MWKGDGLHCIACSSEYKLEDMQAYQDALEQNEQPSQMQWQELEETHDAFSGSEAEHMRSFNCPNCGASVMTDENTAATKCVYCGSPTLIPERFEGGLKPDAVIPFLVTREEAEKKLRAHFHGKKLLPGDFVRACRVEEVTGLYVPYFLFDCQSKARVTYRATRINSIRSGDYEITKTRHFYVEREGTVDFNNIPVDASERVSNVLTEAVEPFDYNALCDFQAAYLSGFQADKYDQTVESCTPRVNERVESSTQEAFRDTVVGYHTVTPDKTQLNFNHGSTRYALLPVWLLTVRYGENAFPFAINGQTGKLVGELPVDKNKYRLLKLAWTAGLTAAIFAILTLLGI